METKVKWFVSSIFGDDINTDDIIRADILQESTDKDFFAKYAFEKYDKDFIKRCQKYDSNVVIWWENFGCGSSREQAVYAFTYNNVNIVIAKSFPDIFYRNSINNGLILVRFQDVEKFKDGDEIEVDLENKKIIVNNKDEYDFDAPEEDLFIMKNKGQFGIVKNYLENKNINIIKWPKNSGWQTMVEKIMSNHVWEKVYAKDKISALPIDLVYMNEVIAPPAIVYFYQDFWKDAKVFDKDRILLVPDHTIPSSSVKVTMWIYAMKVFSKKHGVKMFREWRWIEHIVWIEEGYILPWNIILWTDSHTCTNGAMNCLSFGVWTTDAEYSLATGAIFNVEVPESIKVVLKWKLNDWVSWKDVILEVLGQIGAGWASKKVLEFHGDGLKNLSMDARTTISNMAVEGSARTAIFEYDEEVEKYTKNAKYDFEIIKADEDANYTQVIEIDLSTIEPNVAFPHKPANVCKIKDIDKMIEKSQKENTADFPAVSQEDILINEWFIGSCTNGKYEDLKVAAEILKWKKLPENVTLVVVPASSEIYKKALKEGLIDIFIEAGALVESPNCAKCFGKHMWVAWPESRIISTSNRNYKWRMWSEKAFIFLASPATVAASCLKWKITDPRDI